MAQKEQAGASPAGMAGLVRYYEQEKSMISLKPEHVIWICTGLFVLELVLMFAFRI